MLNDDFDKQFDKQFARMQKLAGWGFVFSVIVTIAVLSGGAWVVYRLLAHFGVI